MPWSSTSQVTCLLKSSLHCHAMLFFFLLVCSHYTIRCPVAAASAPVELLFSPCVRNFPFSSSSPRTSEVHMKPGGHLLPWIFSSTGSAYVSWITSSPAHPWTHTHMIHCTPRYINTHTHTHKNTLRGYFPWNKWDGNHYSPVLGHKVSMTLFCIVANYRRWRSVMWCILYLAVNVYTLSEKKQR